MSAGTAIGMVSESLADLLSAEMALTPAVPATILGPDEPAADRRVNLFLYRIDEHPFLRNLDWQARPGSAGRLLPPPLSLKLNYLVSAHAPNDARTGNTAAHELIGEAMRVLYEHPVVPREHLADGLKDAAEEIRVVHTPLALEEAGRIWSTFGVPYRAVASYEVSVVQLDQRAPAAPAPERVRTIHIPPPEAAFAPPVVDGLDPTGGAAGSTVAFTGAHLARRVPSVRFGTHAAPAAEVGDERFTVTVPAGVEPGLLQVDVDVDGLFHRVFLFEVR
jgi:Pvc16 N-terminal domain/IPT/TIG domain